MADKSRGTEFVPSEQASLHADESLLEQISRYRRENMSRALQPKTASFTSQTTAEEFSVQLSAPTRFA
jgi:hypothetical protein